MLWQERLGEPPPAEASLCGALVVSGWVPGDLRTVEGFPPAFLGVTLGSHAF